MQRKFKSIFIGFMAMLIASALHAQLDLGPNFDLCPGRTVTLDAGPGYLGYSWSNGDNTQQITVGPGTYTVVVLLPDNSFISDEIVIGTIDAPELDLGEDILLCEGENTTTLDAGNHFDYTWSNGATTSTIIVGEGTYSVTVFNESGCDAMDEIVVGNSSLSVDLGADTSICSGATVVLDAGPIGTQYNWSTGETTPSIIADQPGEYMVTVSDAGGCVVMDTVEITAGGDVVLMLEGAPFLCEGTSQILDAGPGFDTYNWSTGETTQSITISTEGTYAVSVSSGECALSDSITVTIPIVAVNLEESVTICEGATAVIEAEGDFDSYLWNTGAMTSNISVSTAGNYSVTVTKDGCTASDLILINVASPDLDLGPDIGICEGGTALLDAGPGFSDYFWSLGSMTPSVTVGTSGMYSVTVTDENGCAAMDTIMVEVGDLSVDLGGDIDLCAGSTATLDPGGGFDSYTWSTGATTQSISVNMAGTYMVTVSNGGCEASDEVDINTGELELNLGPDIILCNEETTTLDAGSDYVSYLWMPGSLTSQEIIVSPGTYTLIVTDENGCTATDEISILDGTVEVDLGADLLLCSGETILLDAGANFTNYSWSTGATTSSITVSTAGVYSVTVSNGYACEASDQIVVELNNNSIDLGDDFVLCDGNSAILEVPDNFESYLWSTGQSTHQIAVNAAGTYSVSVMDAQGCTFEDEITAIFGSASVSLGPDTTVCEGELVALDPGQDYFSYLWMPGGFTAQAIAVEAGTYTVFVVDENGCVASDEITVSYSSSSIDLGPDVSICEGGTLTLTAGSEFTDYQWSTGQTSNQIIINTTGTYSVTATDLNACAVTDEILVSINTPNLDLGPDVSICTNSSIVLDASTNFETYDWSTGASTNAILVTTAGLYSVTVTDEDGCTETDEIEVSVGAISVDLGEDRNICEGGTTTLSVSDIYDTYLWSTGATINEITVGTPAIYGLTVTDGDCEASDIITITTGEISVDLGEDKVLCSGESTLLGAGPGFSAYLWSNGMDTEEIIVTEAGTYAVTVMDGDCEAVDSVVVSIIELTVDLGADIIICDGTNTTLDAGSGYANYLWSTGASSQQIFVDTLGIYSVIVEDENGCQALDEIVVDIQTLEINLGADTTVCEEVALIEAGDSFDEYLWSTGATSSGILVAEGGTYSVTVTQGACTAEDEIMLELGELIIDLGEDQTLCDTTLIELDAGSGFVDYVWSNGASTNLIQISESGTYSVLVTDENGCKGSDDITIAFSTLTLDLGDQITACEGDTIRLNAGTGFTSYFWSTGESTAQISVAGAGTYSVTIENEAACTAEDSILITTAPTAFDPNFLVASFICPGDTLQFAEVSDQIPDSFFWDFGDGTTSTEQQPMHIFENPGEYMVMLRVSFGDCTNQIVEKPVQVEQCRPDQDSLNIGPKLEFSIYPNPSDGFISYDFEYKVDHQAVLELYNALGQKLFTTPIPEGERSSEALDFSRFDRGTYFIVVSSGKALVVEKLVLY